MRSMKKLLSLCLCMMLALSCTPSCAELTEQEKAEWTEWAESELYEESTDSASENAAELTPEEEALLNQLAATLDDTTTDTEVDLSNLEINTALPDYVTNILLMGIDNRSTELSCGRNDANIICSINKNTGEITLTSIGRDTAVEIPGYVTPKRLNASFKYGSTDGDVAKGAELAMKTINRNFQMNISRYVLVNIHGLADIIEAIGGVDLYLTMPEASAINYELFVKEPMGSNEGRQKLQQADGVQHLDGMQAVTYGRIRNLKGQNDLNRNGRQRVLLETLLKTVIGDMDMLKMMSLIETALPYARTNLTLDEMVTLGMAVLSGDTLKKAAEGGELLQQFGIPMEKQYAWKTFNDVALLYISEPRLAQTLTAMQELIYGQSYLP